MATISSNLDAVAADLQHLADAVRLDHNGLGADLLDTIAVGIAERSIGEQKAPDGAAWAPNKEPYASSPKKQGKPVGVLTGEMLALENLKGERTIEPERATMRYGVSAEARDKIRWFTEGRGGARKRDVRGRFSGGRTAEIQAPRPVYDTDAMIDAAVDAKVREHLDKVVAELK